MAINLDAVPLGYDMIDGGVPSAMIAAMLQKIGVPFEAHPTELNRAYGLDTTIKIDPHDMNRQIDPGFLERQRMFIVFEPWEIDRWDTAYAIKDWLPESDRDRVHGASFRNRTGPRTLRQQFRATYRGPDGDLLEERTRVIYVLNERQHF